MIQESPETSREYRAAEFRHQHPNVSKTVEGLMIALVVFLIFAGMTGLFVLLAKIFIPDV